ncbi:MAG: AmmeMemoRadiSam system protein B [Candidatus Omnitrophota bacterium]|jgi:AmmeMemoRadiSam system protein B/AmmeMemoRadiSam system protein A|nr:MAG: AmmeMemoRadiSam system protein B [Candidatus Omnitrophota bacterium]
MKKTIFCVFILCIIVCHQTCSRAADSVAKSGVRKSILAGSWYEGSKAGLTRQVDRYLDAAPTPGSGNRIGAVIAPHAGYEWSGSTAAYGYQPLKGAQYKRVIVLAPSHRTSFRGGSICDVAAYETPLGEVSLDRAVCDALLSSSLVQSLPQAHAQEHSLEIQLPFLQRTLGEFSLIPIVIGDISPGDCVELANLIRPLLTQDTLLVMSSDFTHQGPRFGYVPFKEDVRKNVQRLDFVAINSILNLNVREFWAFTDRVQATICGKNSIKIGMMALPLQTQVEFLHYETSGDKQKDYSETVSYAAIIFRDQPDYLNEREAELLLNIARKTLTDTLEAKDVKEYTPPNEQITPPLRQKKGVFVTLQKEGMLRGCIGDLDAEQELHKTVARTVLLSALRDQRFQPVQKEELEKIDIEISVMSPQTTVNSWKEIVLGRDGIIVEKGGRSALYLPQVALEQGWDVEETLSHLCEKARLDKDAWKSGCTFKTFSAQVFGETFNQLNEDTK